MSCNTITRDNLGRTQADEVLIINIWTKAVSLNIAYSCFECFCDFDAAPPEKIKIVAIPNSNFLDIIIMGFKADQSEIDKGR
jgi:hypothetical protein